MIGGGQVFVSRVLGWLVTGGAHIFQSLGTWHSGRFRLWAIGDQVLHIRGFEAVSGWGVGSLVERH